MSNTASPRFETTSIISEPAHFAGSGWELPIESCCQGRTRTCAATCVAEYRSPDIYTDDKHNTWYTILKRNDGPLNNHLHTKRGAEERRGERRELRKRCSCPPQRTGGRLASLNVRFEK
ncbi:unnamed protein product [Nezara viridula]|uniref:Uncharacterized protein n=1 Tax=Nezara viridula TaxID=85310 RepID=A0A9P0EEE3_NEZVI|nr:unnamed protein product [Nezara viridula]